VSEESAGLEVREALVEELAALTERLPTRLEVDPETVQQDLARLVFTLVELIRRIVEHQAVRRMEDPDLDEEQIERMGLALQLLEERMAELKDAFGLAGESLNLDLGPLGRLL
jgi:predicted DNA-binding transcriptional regulator YafY